MAKDMVGNEIKPGKKLMFNGMVYEVEDVQENRVIGGKSITGKGISGMKIPDIIILRVVLPFNSDQPFNGVVVENPNKDEQTVN